MNPPVSLGIDLGTSELKAVLCDATGVVLAHAGSALSVTRERPGWSEQHPEDWWQACVAALDRLRQKNRPAYERVQCVGLTGQMHGAVLLDRSDRCIRKAILWNDSRALSEAAALAAMHPSFADITGSLPMAGFTAPKLLWLKEHEPDIFARIDCVVSPKDYLRLKLTGERKTDASDASGTAWLNVRERRWFEPVVQATGLELRQLPAVLEGTEVSGTLSAPVADLLRISACAIVAAGGGDNPASAVGIGAVDPGDAFISLGTSAAIACIADRFIGNTSQGVHGYCHALPDRWYATGAILSGASALRWIARLLSQPNEQTLLDRICREIPHDHPLDVGAPIFLPYLSGERTPHNDPLARGAFVNLGYDASPELLGYAVLEGVGFALRDALRAVESTGAAVSACSLVGGGARSAYWAQLLADILGCELRILSGSELSASIGAAKLAFVAGGIPAEILRTGLTVKASFSPQPTRQPVLEKRYERFRALFPALQGLHD